MGMIPMGAKVKSAAIELMSRAFNDKTKNEYVVNICMLASNNIFSYLFNAFNLNSILLSCTVAQIYESQD